MILESGIALLPPSRHDVSIQLRRLGARDVRGDHLPAEVGKAHPGLALTTDPLAAAHLELEVHGGDVASEGEDLQPDALLLRSRSRRARNDFGDIGRHVDHEACPTSTSSSASRLGPSIITARVSPSL